MQTRGNIFLNLKESTFVTIKGGLRFYFSSNVYKEKFEKEIENYVSTQNLMFEKKYKIKIALEVYFMVVFYSQIEKRGFYIKDEITGKEVTENVVFINNILMY